MDQNNSNQNSSGSVPPENKDTQENAPLLSSGNSQDQTTPPSPSPTESTNPSDETKKDESTVTSPESSTDMPKKEETPAPPTSEVKKDDADPLAALRPPANDAPKPKKNGPPMFMIVVFLIFSFLCGLLIAGWYFQTQLKTKTAKPDTTTTSMVGDIVIGTDPTAPPMESLNKQNALVGYDIDLGYRIGNEIGAKVKFETIPWDSLFKALEDKKIDMIISSVTINDERKQKYNFSDPYINAGQVIVSRKDHAIASVADLKGKKISVQKGTTNEQEAFKYTDKALVLSYDSYDDAAKAASVGTTEAFLSDLTLAKGAISQFDNLKITSDPFTNEYYGIVFRKDEPDLQKKVNDTLSVLRVNGILTDLKQKWLE